MKQAFRLSQAVLASTLFIVPSILYADTVVSTVPPPFNQDFTTGAPSNKGNIQITNAGQLQMTAAAPNSGDAVVINTASTTLSLDANNLNGNAILTTLAARNGVTTTNGDSAIINIGANTGISAVGVGIFADSGTNDIINAGTITSTGAANAIQVTANSDDTLIQNQGTGTITSAGGHAIALNGPTASVNNLGIILQNGGGSGFHGIDIGALNAIIANSGSITGDGNGIHISAGGQGASITNSAGGLIKGTTASGLHVDGTGLSLFNSGTISGVAANADGVRLNQNFTTLTNNAGGIISSTLASGVNITAAVTGDIQNSGTITSAGAAARAGILIGANYTGSITNNAGGIIQTTNGTGADAILIKGAFTAINNSGTIQATAINDSAITVLTGVTGGIINNNGLIQSNNNVAIDLEGNITQINNSGSILTLANSPGVIVANLANVTLAGGIINSGTIKNGAGGAGQDAIDLDGGFAGINIKLFQNGGTIDGDVRLASAGGSIFDMNGGVITGDVYTTNQAVQSTLNLNAGTISGDLTLQGTGGGDTVNLAGATLNAINTGPGNDIFNLSGGSFTSLNGGPGDTLNVLNSFSTSGDIFDVPTVNVKAGTFTVNNQLTGFTALNVGPSASMVVNSNTVTGAAGGAAVVINNNARLSVASGGQIDTGLAGATGSITVNNGGALSLANSPAVTGALTKAFTVNAGGGYGVQIQQPGDYAKLQVGAGGATLAADSFIATQLGTGGFIPTGSQFDIITGGPVVDNSTLYQPGSLTQTFTKSVVGGNILRLTSQRSGFVPFANTDASMGVAGALDTIALLPVADINPQILAVLGQLDLITNQATLVSELESLAPPVNYAMIAATRVSMDQMFRSIRRRIEDMRYLKTLGAESYQIVGPSNMEDRETRGGYTGGNYGDAMMCDRGVTPYVPPQSSTYAASTQGAWVQGYGAILDQHRRHEVDGYLGDAAGFALGMDWGRTGKLVGAAVNFTQSHMVGHTEDQNVQDLQSVQGTVYSWLDLTNDLYLDTMIGFAHHHYKTRRNIGVGTVTTAGFGDFYGIHYGAQAELGYAFLYDFLTVSPITRLRFTHMLIDDYSEQGAGGLSLMVQNQSLNELVGGIGVRLLGKMEFAQAVYAPEFSFMLAYDFYGDEQITSSRFLGGGPLFPTIGVKPAQTMMLFDLGVNVHTYDAYIFTVKGELDMRDHYYGYSGWVQLYRSW